MRQGKDQRAAWRRGTPGWKCGDARGRGWRARARRARRRRCARCRPPRLRAAAAASARAGTPTTPRTRSLHAQYFITQLHLLILYAFNEMESTGDALNIVIVKNLVINRFKTYHLFIHLPYLISTDRITYLFIQKKIQVTA